MKKTLKLFGLAALAAIAFSCTKKDDPFTPGTPTDQTTPTEGQTEEPAAIPATDGGVLTSFGATVDSEATKVTVNLTNGTTAIEEGDEVLVVDSAGNSAIYVYDDKQSKFVLKDGQTAVTVNTTTGVYYPASKYEVDGTVVQLVLPAGIPAAGADDVDFGDINPMAGVITGDKTKGYSVKLKSITSVLRVKVSADVNINSVTLDFGDGNNYADGAKFTVDPSASTLTFVDGTCPENPATVNVSADAADVLFFLPTVYLTDGLTVTANLASNHNGGTKSFSLSKTAYTPTVNKISTMSFYAGLFSGGAGTTESPYIIANKRDFKHISEYCKNGYDKIDADYFLGASYQQTADIDFGKKEENITKKENITDYLIAGVVGDKLTAFSGTYNGEYKEKQYTLSNFTVNGTPQKYDTNSDGKDDDVEGIALFKRVVNAKLQNIAISDAIIYGGKFTAGLAGHASGNNLKIEGCSISGSELNSSIDYGVGGLVGGLYGGKVTSCSAADLTIEDSSAGTSYYGGLICYINGTVEVRDCTLGSGKIEFKGVQKCGGIVGQANNDNITISNCVNNSTIESNKDYLGGIVGYLRAGTLAGCGNNGNISGVAAVGGLVGDVGDNDTYTPKAYGVITKKCYNTGKITGTGNNVGGIAGVVTAGRIEQSRNSGIIYSTGSNVGGIVAQLKVGDINACYSGYNNNIQGASCVGGIVGLAYPIEYSSGNRWLGGTKVINCQSSSYIISTGTESNGAAGCIVGWARQVSGHWGIVIANCTNWGAAGRVKSTNTGSQNLCLGGIVGQLNGGNWAIVDNCFSYTTNNAIQINGENLAKDTAAGTAPFVNVGPIYGYMTGNYATIRDCFYRAGWENAKYLGTDGRSTKTEKIVMIKLANDNVGKGTATQAFNLYKDADETYSVGKVTLLKALNRSAHIINDDSTFKNYQTNVNTSNIAYEGWAQPTSGGWLVPAALVELGSQFYKK